MQQKVELSDSSIIDKAVSTVFQEMGITSVKIKEEKYQAILEELHSISNFFTISNSINKKAHQFSKKYGFNDTLEYAYELLANASEKNLIYHHLNKILSYFRDMKELDYAVYIKDEEGRISRFFLTGEEAKNFTEAAWNTTFANSYKKTGELKSYAQDLIKKNEQSEKLSQHIESYLNVLDGVLIDKKLKMKNADKYEAFESHFQKYDLKGNYKHNFDKKEIAEWILRRGTHNTLAWYQTGDVGLISVKSIDLQEKVQLLTISKPRSLVEVFTLLEQLFVSQIKEDESKAKIFGMEEISTIIKAFTPTVNEIEAEIKVNVEQIVKDIVNSSLFEKNLT